ncbi:hypothetical protein [Leptothoe kymatousa]|uniref:PEGA domain-containing protein n=1 Tax=Leptothoe kymatousa TAU-MAC 1615 TaxID=2364775 RepID=A0ABS5Y1P4_9CYAN|nr:hypothetical protein [Leptothoe kymatousa]MBT9311726.1 hypothetical protein [Leptothoe kymatousa TAU-MAC 1615]
MTRRPTLALAAFFVSLGGYFFTTPANADTIIRNNAIYYPADHRDDNDERDDDDRAVEEREVTVEIVVRGSSWADIYLDNRRVFSPRGLQRSKRFKLKPGIYNIRAVNGTDYFDVWAEGYLQVSHEDVEFVVISFSENGRVGVAGEPDVWIPLSARRP